MCKNSLSASSTFQLLKFSLAFFLIQFNCSRLHGQVPAACLDALQLHRAGSYPEAAVQYRACISVQPGNFEAQSNLGAVLVQLGQYGAAIDSYKAGLTTAPASAIPALQRNLALAYYKSGQIPQAVEILDALRAKQPNDLANILLLADCYLTGGHPERAAELLGPLSDSLDPTVDYLLGTALIRSGHPERGQVVIDRILRRSDSPEAHLLLGAQMLASRDFPKSVAEFTRAIELNADLPSANSYLGQALLATGDADGATTAFRAELTHNPNDREANLRLGQILTARKRYDEAFPLIRRSVAIRPEDPEAHAALAELYTNTGATTEARRETAWLAAHGYSPAPKEQQDGPAVGTPAPPLDLSRHGGPGRTSLAQFRGRSPVLLVFASYSCPQFRAQAETLNELNRRYGSRLPFLLVYIREAHAGDGWQSTINRRDGIDVAEAKTPEQKQSNAELCVRKLGIRYSVAVDDQDGVAEKAYAAWPSRVYLVDRQGVIRFQSHLDEQQFHPSELESALRKVSAQR